MCDHYKVFEVTPTPNCNLLLLAGLTFACLVETRWMRNRSHQQYILARGKDGEHSIPPISLSGAIDKIWVCKANPFSGDYFTDASLMSENSECLLSISSGADSCL
jgi:hypothetical protein